MHLFQFWIPQGIFLGVRLLGRKVVLCLIFKGNFIPSARVAVSIYIPTNKSVPFSAHTLQHLLFEDFSKMSILPGVRFYVIIDVICIDCSHEIKRHLLLGRKVMTNLDSIFKSRDITLPTKVHLVKAMVFPVVRYGCESWTVKKAEDQRIDAFELWCWRKLLRVPWAGRRSILKEINPKYSLEELMLKLKLQYFGYLMQRTDSFEKTPRLGKIEGGRRRG